MPAMLLAEIVMGMQRKSVRQRAFKKQNPQTVKYSGCHTKVYSFKGRSLLFPFKSSIWLFLRLWHLTVSLHLSEIIKLL